MNTQANHITPSWSSAPAGAVAGALLLAAAMFCPTDVGAQDGTVNFRTLTGGVNAPVRDTDGTTLLAGTAFSAQLYAGPSGSAESALYAIGVPVAFLTGASAGYVNGGTVSVTGIAAGAQAALQMRVWETAYGTTFEQAQASGSKTGRSINLALTLGGGMMPAANLTGLQPFSLTPGVRSAVLLTNASYSAGQFSFSFNSLAGEQYRIERADQITQPAWSTLTTVTASSSATAFSESTGGSTSRIYRVFVPATSVYSTNAVGFLTVSFLYGSNWVVNPLENGSNRLNMLIPAPPDGTYVVKTNGMIAFYDESIGGWDPSDLTLLCNEPFSLVTPQPFSVTFVGQVGSGGGTATAPAITSQPQNRTNVVGTTATFSVTATGTEPLSYQWRFNGTKLAAASTTTLVLTNVQSSNEGSYTVVVTNIAGAVTSAVATLTVTDCVPPSLTAGPASATRCVGEAVTFFVGATGTGLSYQWRKDGGILGGATSDNYTINSVAPAHAGSYDCLVSNVCGIAELSRNVVQSPGFEQGTAGWFVIGPCSLTSTTSQAHSGQRSAYITGRADTWNSIGQSLLGVLHPSGSYGISVWLRIEGTTSRTVGVGLTQVDGGGTHYWTIGSVVASPGQWVRIMGGFTLNVSGALTELTLHPDCDAAGVNLYVDDVLVEPMVSSGLNLVENPGFEDGTSDWYVFGSCSLTAPTSQPHSGQRSGYLQGRTDTWNGPAQSLLGMVVPGQVYRIHAWVRMETAGAQPFELTIKQTDSSGTSYPWWYATTVTSTDWTHLVRNFSPNVVGSLSELTFFIQGPASGINFYVDDIVVEPMQESFSPATLTVNSPPTITTQPSGATRNEGQSVTFSVTAAGSSPTYQWRKNGVNIGAATANSYTIPSVTLDDAGNYDCVVGGLCGPTNSQTATLIVNQTAVAPSITVQPQSRTNLVGTTAAFTVSAAGTAPLAYQWRKGGTDIAGATLSVLTLANVQSVDAGDYSVVVTNVVGATNSAVATLTVWAPPAITGQPQSRTNLAGTTAAFTVSATGTTPLAYQWRKNGANLAGATLSVLTLANVQLVDAASYSVVVSNVAGTTNSAVATLTVWMPPTITGQPQSRTNLAGTTAAFTVSATGTAPLSYQWRKDGTDIAGATLSVLTLANVQLADTADYSVVVTNVAGTTNSAVGSLTVWVPPSITGQPQSRTNLAGTTAAFTVSATGTAPLSYQWRKDGTDIAGATLSVLTLANVQLADTADYSVVVTNVAGATNSAAAALTVWAPPVITGQPQSRTNVAGTTASFIVSATGTAPLSYQWRKDGTDIAGATLSVLTLADVQPVDAAGYAVVVTNVAGATNSAVAVLTVRSYCVGAQVAAAAYPIGTTVPVGVRTFDCGNTNLAAPNAPAVVWIRTQGTERGLPVVTDTSGQATVDFQPLPGEGGVYEVAAGVGFETNAPAQATFTLVGMTVSPAQASHRLKVGLPQNGSATLQNASAAALSGLGVVVQSKPANISVQASVPDWLGGQGAGELSYALTATGDSPAQGTVTLRVDSAQGASAVLTLNLEVAPAAPQLAATPSPLTAAMLRGGQALASLELRNAGSTPATGIQVLLPTKPWLSLVTASNIAALGPDEAVEVTLSLRPTNNLPLGPYTGSLVFSANETSLTVPFTFTVVSDLKGHLLVEAVDEFTYYAAGSPKVTNATVILSDPVTHSNLVRGVTDSSGAVLFTNLTEAYYDVELQAEKHGSFRTTFLVVADQTNQLRAFLPRQMVSYNWVVRPTEIQDHYTFTLLTTFETEVPAPVVTIGPDINLCSFSNVTTTVNLEIANHGLIAAKNARLHFDSHPCWAITPLVSELGDIAAKTNLTVPVVVRRLSGTNGPPNLGAWLDWHLATTDGPRYYRQPIFVYGANPPGCIGGGVAGEGYGGVPWFYTGGGGGGGGSPGGPIINEPSYTLTLNDVITVRVKLKTEQSAVMSRSAFVASLEIVNNAGSVLENLAVSLDLRDGAQQAANDRFGIRPPELAGLNAVDGTGVLADGATGRATWTLIPATNAAPTQTTPYTVGGMITYQQDGQQLFIPLFPLPIQVLPDPRLVVDYFQERDVYSDDPFTPQVEPAVPFALGLRLKNEGYGTARSVRITSGQPQIVENESGLLIDFQLISSQVGGQPATPSLAVELGDIGMGDSAVAIWWMTASLQGRFVEYEATFDHVDDLGNTNLSLVDRLAIHETIHAVRADDPADDDLPDFLVNDDRDTNILADALYLSDGTLHPVTTVTNGSSSGPPTPGDPDVLVTASLPGGWVYLRISDPGNAAYPLGRVRRSDGHELRLGDNVWLTHRIIHRSGQPDRVEDRLHLLDYNSTGSYTVTYGAVASPPDITQQPQSCTNVVGTSAIFTVSATGTAPLSYQWRKNGTNVAGATLSVLTLANVQPVDAAGYSVVVTNVAGATNSAVATLTVWVPPTITAHPQSRTNLAGTTASFTVSATGTTPLSYQWRKDGTDLAGATLSVLTLANVQPVDAAGYSVVVTNVAGATNSAVATLTVWVPPTITAHPQSRTNTVGGGVAFTVAATGTTPLRYQWRKDGAPLTNGGNVAGASTATLLLANVQPVDAAGYSVVVTNVAGATNSAVATLTVWVPPTITAHPQSRTNLAGTTASFTVSATGTTPLSYQWRKDGTDLAGATLSVLTLANVQPVDAAGYSVVVTNVAGSTNSAVATLTVWVPPTITAHPQSRTNLAGTTASFTVSATGTTPLGYQWRKDGTNVAGATLSVLTLANVQPADAAGYSVVVTNVAGSTNSAVATLTVWVPPTITAHPQSRTVFEGANISLVVVANGTLPLAHQWSFGDTPLTGATNATLTLLNVQTNQAGRYGVRVSNVAGSTNSETASLCVQYFRQYALANTNEIRIRDLSPALPYPSAISVHGLDGTVAKVTVTLSNLTHTWPADIDALLVGPQSQSTLLMSDVGGEAVNGQTFTFDDEAPASLPYWDYLVSGAYRPTSYRTNEAFASPAPSGPYGVVLDGLSGMNPNGEWSLFVRDVAFKDSGRIAKGWELSLRVLHLATGELPVELPLLVSQASYLQDGRFQFVVIGKPGSTVEIWASGDLASWTLSGTVTNTSGIVTFTDPSATGTQRFYRAVLAR